MGSYEIRWKSSAVRDIHNIDRQQIQKIIRAVESLADNPFPRNYLKIQGSEEDYRIRIGDYRAIYQVHTRSKVIIIYHIRHRKHVYRK